MQYPQLPLSLGLKDSTVFANFVAGPNAEVLDYLQNLNDAALSPCIYLWGAPVTGKTHLLQAICHAAGQRGQASVFLPLSAHDEFPVDALQGLETIEFVCIDDIHAIAGHLDWETALMNLYDRTQEAGHHLIITGTSVPAQARLQLPHLASRLAWGLIFQLKALDDAEKQQALSLRAQRRGVSLPQESVRYLVRHHGADISALLDTFDRLDQASLAAKRRLTVPFIRSVLQVTEPPG